jgi:hypothetical protein
LVLSNAGEQSSAELGEMDRGHQRVGSTECQRCRGAVGVGRRQDHEARWGIPGRTRDRWKELSERSLIEISKGDENRVRLGGGTKVLLLQELEPGSGQGSFQAGRTGGSIPHQEDLGASRLLEGRLDHAMKESKWIS